VFIVFPWWKFGFNAWIVGYLLYGITCGITISTVFQLAHVVKGIQKVEMKADGNIGFENAIHQLKTTADFARNSRIAEFLFGGLNFQIEHHLFPHVSHIHYYNISKIAKRFCKENDLPYLEYPTFWHSLWAHIQRLSELGDKKEFA
jgi:linoleoyl-CoA desaturase